MSRARYLAARALLTVFLLFVVLSLLWLLFQLFPGGYRAVLLAQGASPEAVAAFERRWGLNQPLYIQYLTYIKNFLSGNMGTSFQTGEPVWDFVKVKIFNTFILAAPAIIVAYLIGSVLGAVFGFERGSRFERGGLIFSLFAGSFPSFFLAMLAVIVFSGILDIFPPNGMVGPETYIQVEAWYEVYFTRDFLYHYTLPFLTIVTRYYFLPTIMMRTSVVEVANQEFMYYHKVSGFPFTEKIKRLIRHASLPVITLYPVSLTQSISGLVLIEAVFNWPGIGNTIVISVFNRDFPVLIFLFFLTSAFVIIANFVVDVVYTLVDPRITIGDD
jgi:peptide/nickel transport system permease protein